MLLQTDGEPAIRSWGNAAQRERVVQGCEGDPGTVDVKSEPCWIAPIKRHGGEHRQASGRHRAHAQSSLGAEAEGHHCAAATDLAIVDQARRVLVEPLHRAGKRPHDVRGAGHDQIRLSTSTVRGKRAGLQDLGRQGKLASKGETGVWLGRSTTTNEHLIGCPTGAVKCRKVKRRSEDCQWDKQLYDSLVWVPWVVDRDPEIRARTAWKPTPECAACDKSPVLVVLDAEAQRGVPPKAFYPQAAAA